MNFHVISEKFENYFLGIYQDRWVGLRTALQEPVRQCVRLNRFVADPQKDELTDLIVGTQYCYWKPQNYQLQKNNQFLFEAYVLDFSSVIVAMALEAQGRDHVLDLCAAPGGKSLILAESIFFNSNADDRGKLVANEMSEPRRQRLMNVFQDYIPREYRDFIHVKGLDGNQYGLRQPEAFDRVLADVPCSGERHLFENQSELKLWTQKRTQNLAVRQYSLLCSAWLACRTGGRIVYSTCSISPIENDAVVAKLIKKKSVRILRPEFLNAFSFLEKTEWGYQILPDRNGFGPMYFSVLEKGT